MSATIASAARASLSQIRLSSSVRTLRSTAVKRLLLDYLGVAIAGSQTESGRAARMFAQCGGRKAEASLIGDTARVPAALAAFANAISSHSIELDDIDVLALFHFSPPVFSAALATAEQHSASGKQSARGACRRLRNDGAR